MIPLKSHCCPCAPPDSCGAIAVRDAVSVVVTDSTFTDCSSAGGDGGAFCHKPPPKVATTTTCVNGQVMPIGDGTEQSHGCV